MQRPDRSGHRRVVTARLELRAMESSDVDELFAILSDPGMWTYDPPRRHTQHDQTAAYVARAAARWTSDGLSYWTVRLRDTGEVIGSGGVQAHAAGSWNLNYRIATRAQGRGLATELARTAISAAHSADPERVVVAWVDESNLASRQVAERVGLVDRGIHPTPNDGVPRIAYADSPLGFDADR